MNGMKVRSYSKAKDGNTALTRNFKVREFACKDGSDTIFVSHDLVEILQKIRDHFGKAVTINSGYRTVTYNKKVGGAANSYHMRGMAADITAKSVFYNTALYTEIRIMHQQGLIPLTECYLERQGLYIHVAYDPAAPSENPFFTK